jgi:nicotinamidase-related amidase
MTGSKEEIYEKAKLGGQVGFGKRPCVLVVDYQKGITSPEFSMGANMDDAVLSTVRIVEAARKKNIKCAFTRCAYSPDGKQCNVFGMKMRGLKELNYDDAVYGWDERLGVCEDDFEITKHWPSAFFGTSLVQYLNGLGVDTIILCGCTISGCLYASAVDCCSYGFRTTIPVSAVADRSKEVGDMFLWNLGQKYVDLKTEQEVFDYFDKLPFMEYDRLPW